MNYYGLTTVLDPALIKITQSDLAAFKRDRRIWFLKTYLGLRPNAQSVIGPLTLGTIVHAALEAKYKHGHDMLPWFFAHVNDLGKLYEVTVPNFSWDTWNKQAEMGRVMLEGYEEWVDTDNLDARYETWAVEKQLTVTTSYLGAPVVLTGKADLIVTDTRTGALKVFDWKTAANLARTVKQAHTTEQLPFYISLLTALEPGHRVDGAAFNILLKSKRTARATPPFYIREFVSYDRAALAARQESIDGTIVDYVRTVLALNAGASAPLRVAYANPSVQSWDTWLDPLIEVMDTGGNVDAIIRAAYTQDDPYARYVDESPMLSGD